MRQEYDVDAVEMAMRIPRFKAWAITGTPVGNQGSMNKDLRGLFAFLGLFNEYMGLRPPVMLPTLMEVIKRFMIRHSKASVHDQLMLPKQYQSMEYVHFSEVEEHFYCHLRETMTEEVSGILGHAKQVQQHGRAELHHWLLRLRQTW